MWLESSVSLPLWMQVEARLKRKPNPNMALYGRYRIVWMDNSRRPSAAKSEWVDEIAAKLEKQSRQSR